MTENISYKKVREQVEQIAKIQSPIEKEQWIKVLAMNAHVSAKVIKQELTEYQRQILTGTSDDLSYTDQERAQASELLKSNVLLNNFLDACHTRYVGRDKELILLKLATLSRHFDMGLSVVITGTSAVGKSELIKTILQTVYPPDCEDFTRTSEQYLLYREKPLDHKIITFYEMHGAKSASYLLRTALSEGNLKLGTVISNSKVGIVPKDIEKSAKGLVIFSSTTEQNLDPELETRLIKIEITHDEQLARKVYQLNADSNDNTFKVWQCADSLIKSLSVKIPFEKELANLFATKEERYLRDFKKVKLLITASALFHQYQRPRKNDNCILATQDDYALVYSLRDLISQSVNIAGSHIIDFLQKAEALGSPTREELQNALNKSCATMKRYIKTTLDSDLIETTGKGKRQTIKVVDIPKPISALPAPETIFNEKTAYAFDEPVSQTSQVIEKYNDKLAHSHLLQNEPVSHSDRPFSSSAQSGSNGSKPAQNLMDTTSDGNGSSAHEVYIHNKMWLEPALMELSTAQTEALEERIAIMEFDGELSHEQAVRSAVKQIFDRGR